ncbi:Rne/Rng family ribonuclease [Thermovibrio ammonificans]|uniref:Ribonuclease G n=1 Tax=Thermovibrio ammonificans (strain DSM 15698 / JCM 12110 / HB-1) TaxID=648996 RepID=E8T3G6_THEA1|nr:Rne/Rng family ribonuclease [Thermovibrio ammonificans]ADU96097.1 ribonuclease, Rne/Rng family [Thermovibrio ammonificans HB-1]
MQTLQGKNSSGKQILINSSTKEVRIAVLEEGELVEFYVERKGNRGLVGNIYKGKVTKIVPAVQAAFVDIGESRSAFLYVKDAVNLELDEEELEEEAEFELPPVEEVLSVGQELLVQVAKEPIGTKGPRVTTNITIPGHYLVLLPTINKLGLSRRITDEAERERLKEIASEIKPPEYGLIVRTAAEGASKEELEKDLNYILKVWEGLKEKAQRRPPPTLLYQDLEIVPKTLRDLLTEEVTEVIIDSRSEFERALSFTKGFIPKLADRIKLYEGKIPLFEKFQVEKAIEKALSRKVYLPGGGYIVIDETEALVSIDVNSGKFKKSSTLEETALEINLKAAREIARQLRLRDIGGIIVIDFIDMKEPENKELLLKTLEEELSKDRARTKIVSMSDLGLVEMTRKRVKKSLGKTLTVTCPYCEGRGRVKSPETVAFEIERELLSFLKGVRAGRPVTVYANPSVAQKLKNEESEILERIKEMFKVPIKVVPVQDYHIEKFTISLN